MKTHLYTVIEQVLNFEVLDTLLTRIQICNKLPAIIRCNFEGNVVIFLLYSPLLALFLSPIYLIMLQNL